jgi:spermidine/putrescine transport system substrate-binding protein
LLVREDITPVGQVTHWADLWDPRYVGKVALRMQPDELIGVALKASGRSLNSESPEELEEAYQKLLDLREITFIPEPESEQAMEHFLDSGALIMVGWSQDAIEVQRINKNVRYILPREGSLLWSDNFTISANSSNTDAAYKFIDFMLEPEINASIVNEKYYPTANQAALAYVLPEIRINRVIYPLHEDLARSEWYLPRSSKGNKIYQEFCQKVISNMH